MKSIEKRKVFIILIVISILLPLLFPLKVNAKEFDRIKLQRNIGLNNIIDFDRNKNKINIAEYRKGQAIIMYEESSTTLFKLKSSSILNDYTVERTVDFKNVVKKTNEENQKMYTMAKGNENSTTLLISLIKSNKHSTEELIKILEEKDWIESAEPNYIVKTNSITSDKYIDYQWGIENNGQNAGTVGLDINPIESNSEEEKVIVVLDSGVDYTHPDLVNAMWVNPYNESELQGRYGYDFYNYDNDPMDDAGHGTHCAGIIAGESNNQEGITGAVLGAKNIKIMALKFLGEDGGGDFMRSN